MNLYKVKYHAGPYEGVEQVAAYDEEEALAKVRAKIRRTMTLPMYSDSYRVVDVDIDHRW